MTLPRALWLVHPDGAACDAIRGRFGGLPGVTVHAARFADLAAHDAFVTAGNAYGIMTAGIDAAVVARFGRGIMAQVQRHIVGAFLGEQPVGTTGRSRAPTRSTARRGRRCCSRTRSTRAASARSTRPASRRWAAASGA